ncbi:MAG: FKBP-type peptidyl-prolyl cis-trans isomerase [Candidatus Micrarchaeia archaeon]
MAFKEGDFLKVEYSMWRAADNSLLYTTDKQLAEKSNIYSSEAKYTPQLVVVGKGSVVKGVDAALRKMELNKTERIELEPKDAFGERDPELVRVMPLSDLRSRDINPYPGMRLNLDGVVATVRSINSGRVLVDANHELAGEKLIYELKVVEKIEGDKAKVEALAESYSIKAASVSVENGAATLAVSEEVDKESSDYFVNKNMFLEALFKYIEGIKRIEIRETYSRDKVGKQAASKEQEQGA